MSPMFQLPPGTVTLTEAFLRRAAAGGAIDWDYVGTLRGRLVPVASTGPPSTVPGPKDPGARANRACCRPPHCCCPSAGGEPHRLGRWPRSQRCLREGRPRDAALDNSRAAGQLPPAPQRAGPVWSPPTGPYSVDVNALPEPQPQVDLDELVKFIPEVAPVDEADPELVSIGERYWALAGFEPELGTPVWCEKTKDIDTSGWGRQIYAVAAAGVRAVVPNVSCPQCAGPLSLTSRKAFQQLCTGQDSACVECTASLLAAVRVVLDPARKAKRKDAKVKQQERRAVDRSFDQWRKAQQEAIAQTHPAVFPSEPDELPLPLPLAPVREMIAALALLRYAPSTTPIAEIGS